MKILYFSRGYTPHDHRFLSAIAEGGHEAVFLRLRPELATETRRLPKGVRTARGRLKDVIARVQPDLLHAGPLTDCGFEAARSGFHPLVQMSWGSDVLREAKTNAKTRSRVRFALRNADVVIGDCQIVKKTVVTLGAPANRVVTFPWGVDLTRFNPRGGDGGLRARLDWQENFVLLHLRAYEAIYDPLTVARAFIAAARREPHLRLLMPGSGSLRPKIHRLFAKAGMQDRVFLPGQVAYQDLPDYYRAADLYVSASLSDGSSVSLMEALASGLPALVSNIPGNREWVQPGKQGWLFPAGNATALEKLIRKAVHSKQLGKMAKGSRRTAEKKADWPRNKRDLFKAYELAMKAGS